MSPLPAPPPPDHLTKARDRPFPDGGVRFPLPESEVRRRRRMVAFRLPSLRALDRLERAVRLSGKSRNAFIIAAVRAAVEAEFASRGA